MLNSRHKDNAEPTQALRQQAIPIAVTAGAGGFVQRRLSTTPHRTGHAAALARVVDKRLFVGRIGRSRSAIVRLQEF